VTFIVVKSFAVTEDGNIDDVALSLAERAAGVAGLGSSFVGRTLPGGINDGQIIWRAAFAKEMDYQDYARAAPTSIHNADCLNTIAYHLGRHGSPHPNLRDGIWRALVVSVLPGIDQNTRLRFEAEMLAMPGHVSTIRNWALSRVTASLGARPWSYVWEQDFDSIDGLHGEYMMHPIHWGSIDRWYDIEHPDHIADGFLIHTACASATAQIR
jgi:Stress responsive A/B Barrel Domain